MKSPLTRHLYINTNTVINLDLTYEHFFNGGAITKWTGNLSNLVGYFFLEHWVIHCELPVAVETLLESKCCATLWIAVLVLILFSHVNRHSNLSRFIWRWCVHNHNSPYTVVLMITHAHTHTHTNKWIPFTYMSGDVLCTHVVLHMRVPR